MRPDRDHCGIVGLGLPTASQCEMFQVWSLGQNASERICRTPVNAPDGEMDQYWEVGNIGNSVLVDLRLSAVTRPRHYLDRLDCWHLL
jgi:hypothetical protein